MFSLDDYTFPVNTWYRQTLDTGDSPVLPLTGSINNPVTMEELAGAMSLFGIVQEKEKVRG